jgi:hypothetical protein
MLSIEFCRRGRYGYAVVYQHCVLLGDSHPRISCKPHCGKCLPRRSQLTYEILSPRLRPPQGRTLALRRTRRLRYAPPRRSRTVSGAGCQSDRCTFLGCSNYEALADVGPHQQRDGFRKPLDITLVPAMLDVGPLNLSGAGAVCRVVTCHSGGARGEDSDTLWLGPRVPS